MHLLNEPQLSYDEISHKLHVSPLLEGWWVSLDRLVSYLPPFPHKRKEDTREVQSDEDCIMMVIQINQSYIWYFLQHFRQLYILISLCSPSFYSLFQQKAEKIKLQEFSIPVTPSGVGRDQEEKFFKCL